MRLPRILRLNSINKKICTFVSLIIIISIVGISSLNFMISKKELARSNHIILKNAIESTMVEINRNYRYSSGEEKWLDEEEAKANALASIDILHTGDVDAISQASQSADTVSSATENSVFKNHALDLGESGYFFVINSQGDIISHPFLSENIYNLKSHDGRLIVQEIIDRAKSGGGTLNYALTEDVSIITDSKTVYAQYFPYWDWVVCAVIYDLELARGSNIILHNNLVAVPIILAISLFIAIWISGKITKPIKRISQALYQVAEGDLTVEKIEISATDETKLLGDSMNRLIDRFNHILKLVMSSSDNLNNFAFQLNESSEMVSEATTEVTKAMIQMASTTEDQSKETQNGVQMVTVLGDYIKDTADASARIETVVQENMTLKEEGFASVNILKAANQENTKNSEEMENVIQRINQHSKDIGEITTIISKVTSQTNMLALNASIEASRAGEHGSGFAVVAEEIRKLANATASATERIRGKIEEMQSQSEEAVRFIHINNDGVQRINQAVSKTEDMIQRISEGLETLIDGIQIIVNQNFEINRKKDDILATLHHMSENAESNSAAIEEISASAQEQTVAVVEISNHITKLHDMVTELNGIINEFKIK